MSPIILGFIAVIAVLALIGSSKAEDFSTGEPDVNSKYSLSDGATKIAFAMAGFETGTREAFDPRDNSAWQGQAKRNNNPGNLRNMNGVEQSYQSPAGGFAAMINDIEAKIVGHTTTGLGPDSSISDLVNVWTATVPDRPAYIAFVSSQVGVDPSAPFSSFINVASRTVVPSPCIAQPQLDAPTGGSPDVPCIAGGEG